MNFFSFAELPNNFYIEEAVLSIFFSNPFLVKNVFFLLHPKSFYNLSHRIIYETIQNVLEKHSTFNLTFFISSLQDQKNFEKIGGMEKIMRLLNKYESPTDLQNYIQILNDKLYRRILIEFGNDIIQLSYTSSESLEKILEKIDEKLFFLNQQKMFQKTYKTSEIIDEVYREIKEKISKKEKIGFSTSFQALDELLNGIQKSDLIILAGRPSMGKTALALNIGKNLVENYRIPMILFSLEMSRQQIIYRFLSSESNIDSNRVKSGKMTALEWRNLSKAMKKLSQFSIFIDDNSDLSLPEIRSTIQKIFQNTKKKGFIIIDYLQLMKTNLKFENRTQEISYLTRNLKMLAKEFEIPIFLLSQLSRGVESRTNKKPLLSDLRESGCIAKTNTRSSFIAWNKNSFYTFSCFLKNSLKGKKPYYCLQLEKNQKVFLTGNQKILSNFGWIRMAEFTKNSQLLTFPSLQKEKKNKLLFCQITKIDYEQINYVYEKNIPFFHNFLEKDLFFHNSIEQDADIVIMIYREDYYNEKKSFLEITELIIAKHRNGPTGTVKLIFNPVTTNFYNAKNRA